MSRRPTVWPMAFGPTTAAPPLTVSGSFWSSRAIVPLKPAAAVTAALLVLAALVATSTIGQGHGFDTQAAGHTDCDACHFRHLSVVPPDRVPAPSAPDLVAHGVPFAHPQGEGSVFVDIQSTRGPPA